MVEKQLISNLRQLRQLKPSQDWVSLSKKTILGEETKNRGLISVIKEVFSYKPVFVPVFAGFLVVFTLFGLFGFVKNSLPGDPLYLIRKVVHEGRLVFIPEAEKPAFQMRLANDRLEDLTKAPAKNLAPTINEFQASISQAVKELSKIDATTSSPATIKKIVQEAKKLEENKQKVESLGVVLDGTGELENILGKIVKDLIDDIKSRTLSEEKQKTLVEMEKLFEEGKYSAALESYLINQ